VFFSLAAVWFVALGLVPAETVPPRTVYGYHALMMLTMARMYTFIHGLLFAGRSSTHHHTGMDIAGKVVQTSAESPGWITAINWLRVRRLGGRRDLLDVRFRSKAAGWVDRRMVAFARYAGSSNDGRRDAYHVRRHTISGLGRFSLRNGSSIRGPFPQSALSTGD
jgi:Domain of unknown function (DUF5134)